MANVENLISGRREATDAETRFQSLVQSPLRAAILRFLFARPEESFDVEALMQTFGRMRLDVENCIKELVAFGVVHRKSSERHAALCACAAGQRCRARHARSIPRAAGNGQPRGSFTSRTAIPGNDRP